jgi:ABC-type bacteriocin/lantibiotic exporter with double-glycine peptidase domain
MTFGGGAGHAFDAISRLKNNKIMRESRKRNKMRARYLEEVLKVKALSNRSISIEKLTEEERQLIRIRIKKQAITSRIKGIIAFLITVLLLIAFIYIALHFKKES